MDTGVMIALQVIGLYVFVGPFVFLGLYILFDRLAENEPAPKKETPFLETHPDLWTTAHARAWCRKISQARLDKA